MSGWRSAEGRRADVEALDAAIGGATTQRDAEELASTLQASGIGAGWVQSPADLLERDPQLAHRGHWRRLPHEELGPAACNAPPFRFDHFDVGPHAAAPLLGEHTRDVCETVLGLGGAEIDALVEDGVLR